MKRLIVVCLLVVTLFGCGKAGSAVEDAMGLRDRLLKSNGCSFDAVITADYGEDIYTFGMKCNTDKDGQLTFTVIEPETISGISGVISESSASFTFDEQALLFELLADGQVSPISAPWFFVQTLRGGYIRACTVKRDGLHMIIDDTYEDNALQMDIYTDAQMVPIRGEILFDGRRILSLDIQKFMFL